LSSGFLALNAQSLEITEGIHSLGISCICPTMLSFCSKIKFHCAQKVAAAWKCVITEKLAPWEALCSFGKAALSAAAVACCAFRDRLAYAA
jgi:hypothetical protein